MPPEGQADPRRLRRSGVQSTNYEETLPTPTPAGEAHRSPLVGDPVLEPTPMEEGPMVSEGPIVAQGRSYGHVGCDTCDEGTCNRRL